MKDFRYPKSFPNTEEELFLKLVLSSEHDFPKLWKEWKEKTVFDDINYATLRLIPFLYLRLKNLNITDGLVGRIKGIYRLAWCKNQLILDSVRDVIALLDREHIPVMLLKGIPLLEKVYKDSGARFLGDGDMFVDPQHIKKVISIMRDNNWEYLYQSPFSINQLKEPLAHKTIREVTFVNKKGIEVDIHWSLFMFLFEDNKDHLMSYDEVYKHSVEFDLRGVKCKTPCIEDMIIHIIVHGAEQNNHRTLRWVLDTVNIIKLMPIDWNFLIERTKQFGVAVDLNVAFSYLRENFSITVPESFIKELSQIPVGKEKIKKYYKAADTFQSSLLGRFPHLWRGYWLYQRRGNALTGWYYFLDYICQNWGITKKRQLPFFVIEKYKKRISDLF